MTKKFSSEQTAPVHPLLKQLQELHGKGSSDAIPRELALATAVILIEVATCDSQIKNHERTIIHSGLRELFGVGDQVVAAIMSEAQNLVQNMRGSSSFASLLNVALDPLSKQHIADLIDQLIAVDGNVDGYEIYLRNRFRQILGLPDKATTQKASNS